MTEGNAAAVTTTINSLYGSGVVVAGAGFLLNDEMDDFAAKPGSPNQFGLVQGESNAIEPGKRMLSSMCPTIVADRRGQLSLVVGTPGGATIITSVFQVISNVIDHRMTLAQAVAAPRIHHQALPDRVFYEPHGLTPEVRDRLIGDGLHARAARGVERRHPGDRAIGRRRVDRRCRSAARWWCGGGRGRAGAGAQDGDALTARRARTAPRRRHRHRTSTASSTSFSITTPSSVSISRIPVGLVMFTSVR